MNYQCQICDVMIDTRIDSRGRSPMKDWTIHIIDFEMSRLEILACMKCSQMNLDGIFEGYKSRIRDGRHPDFH